MEVKRWNIIDGVTKSVKIDETILHVNETSDKSLDPAEVAEAFFKTFNVKPENIMLDPSPMKKIDPLIRHTNGSVFFEFKEYIYYPFGMGTYSWASIKTDDIKKLFNAVMRRYMCSSSKTYEFTFEDVKKVLRCDDEEGIISVKFMRDCGLIGLVDDKELAYKLIRVLEDCSKF